MEQQIGNSNLIKIDYKIGLNLSSKVNDYVKFNSRFIVGDRRWLLILLEDSQMSRKMNTW